MTLHISGRLFAPFPAKTIKRAQTYASGADDCGLPIADSKVRRDFCMDKESTMNRKICYSALLSLVLTLPASSSQSDAPQSRNVAAVESNAAMTAARSNPALPPGSAKVDANSPGDFQLGVGDVIHVSVWREQELTQTAVVRPDGKISLPLAGEITVAGKTAAEAQTLASTQLRRFINDPQVTISVIEIHSRQVFITGQIQRPGAYPLVGSVSVLQLIASAGGLSQYAHRKGIVVLDAQNHARAKFDYNTAIKGNDKDERLLQPGDTVVVP
jgi:polysaccharide export outer membrane protein